MYAVKYRIRGLKKFTKIKNVIGDGFEIQLQFRYLVLKDKTQIHLPLDTEVIFSPGRVRAMEKKMSNESGIDIKTRS